MVEFHVAVFHGMIHFCHRFIKVILFLMRKRKGFSRIARLLRGHLSSIESGGCAGSGANLFKLAAEYVS